MTIGIDAAGHLLYTVPADRVALVKSVRIVNTSATNGRCQIGIGGVAKADRILERAVSSTDTFVDGDTDPVVMTAGQTLYGRLVGSGMVAGDMTVTISGAELIA